MQSILQQLKIDPENFSWHDLASCKNFSFNLFFEEYESNKTIAKQVDLLCWHCPVQKECFTAGTQNKEIGVWGGFYLINGEVDGNKNAHKELQLVKEMMGKIFNE